jgi:hypothetical protein
MAYFIQQTFFLVFDNRILFPCRKVQDKIKLVVWLQILKINEHWELEVDNIL